MAKYEIEITSGAERDLRKIPSEDQPRVAAAMLALADDPHPRGCRKLVGYDDVFRVRVGTYRILYSVSGRRLIIIVLKIGHRRSVYR